MDCISVYAAGFHNVIASSGTAFTELQAKLLGRFSKNVVVNFDPDTAGAKATERTLGLLVEEEFTIKVLTLEQGFDPDLYIRRKGKEAYGEALRHSQKYFDYLIERARAQFPVRSAEGKVKAVNYLLPHIQRIPSRIVRDELAHEIAQKLGIDSAVLRQELRHAAVDALDVGRESPRRSAGHRSGKDPDSRPGLGAADAVRRGTSFRPRRRRGRIRSRASGAIRPAERSPASRPGHRIAGRVPAQRRHPKLPMYWKCRPRRATAACWH